MRALATQRRAAAPDAASATRVALVAAARTVVARHGLVGATSRRIADEAGANLASITYWFGSKDQLVAEALASGLESRVAPVMELLESDRPATVRLAEATAELVAEFERSRDEVPAHLHALVLAADGDAAGAAGRAVVAILRSRLAAVIAELVTDGVVAAWVDPNAMASLIVATANGIALQARLELDGPSVGDVAAQFAALLLAASASR